MPDSDRTEPALDTTAVFRTQAAAQTQGISSNIIYEPILQAISARRLGGDLLDYGSGAGNLTRLLLETKSFRSVAAADLIYPGAPLPSVKYVKQDLNLPLAVPEASYDVLIACEVIEHLENPRAVVRDWQRLLRPGGTLIVSTPNVETWKSMFMLAARGYFAAFTPKDYPAHITAVTRSDFTRIYSEARLDAPEFLFTGHGLVPFLSPLTWQKLSFGALRGARYSDTVVAVATKS